MNVMNISESGHREAVIATELTYLFIIIIDSYSVKFNMVYI